MGGRGHNYYISPKQAGRMHRTLSLYNSSFAIGTPNMYNCVKEKHPYFMPYEVSTNETWDFAIKMYQHILVKEGSTLTIKCEVRMPIDGQIIVEQGAKLIIDGGVITSAHNEPWNAISVYGDRTKNQYPYSGVYKQGYLELKNGAILENCIIGIKSYGPFPSTSGGIIKASNSIFRNIRIGADFLVPYQNYKINGSLSNPADWRPNVSVFNNCTFEITQPVYNPFDCCIRMYKVDGIKIIGCTLQNTSLTTTFSNLGIGIKTLDASFNVYEKCSTIQPVGVPCPQANMDKNEFKNLRIGVSAYKATGTYKYSVRNSLFTNCQIGIINNGVSNSWITDNEFIIGATPFALPSTPQVGIELTNNILGFKVENNKITEAAIPSGSDVTVGIWSYNTGTNNNSIYRNQMFTLDRGIQSEKLNKQAANVSWASGLLLRCNKMTNGGFDIIVPFTNPGGDPNEIYYGIKPYQGGVSLPAGNEFSNNTDLVNDEFYNYSGYYGLTYYYKPAIPVEYPNDVLNVTRLAYPGILTNYCASTYGYGGHTIAPLGPDSFDPLTPVVNKTQSIQDFADNNALYNSYSNLLKNTIDGGNTLNKKNEVANAAIGQTMLLREKLLQNSPFLSEDVLKEAADKTDVLPDAILLEVLLANPHAIKSNSLVKHLQEKSKPLPAWMVDFLKANSGKVTYLTMLSSLVTYYDTKRTDAIYNVIDFIMIDTNGVDHTQLRGWIAELKNPQADYLIVESFLQTGNLQDAKTFLNTIETNYTLDSYMKADYQNYKTFIEFYIELIDKGRDWPMLNSSEVSFLSRFAGESEYTGSNRAKNVLNFFYEYDYWIEPDLSKPQQPKNMVSDFPVMMENKINIYPNPGNDWVVIDYEFFMMYEDITLLVTDQLGKFIYSQAIIPDYIGTHVLDTRGWATGVYFYQLTGDGQTIKKDKLVIAH